MNTALLLLAQAGDGSSWQTTMAVVSSLLSMGVAFFALVRIGSGKANERQVEPTQIAAISAELKAQTSMLAKLDRESGITLSKVEGVEKDIEEIKSTHAKELEGVHVRLGGISREGVETRTRVDGLEKREGKKS